MPGGNFKAKPGMTPLLSEAFTQMSIQGLRKLGKVLRTPYSEELPKKENAENLALRLLALLKKAGIEGVEEPASSAAASSAATSSTEASLSSVVADMKKELATLRIDMNKSQESARMDVKRFLSRHNERINKLEAFIAVLKAKEDEGDEEEADAEEEEAEEEEAEEEAAEEEVEEEAHQP